MRHEVGSGNGAQVAVAQHERPAARQEACNPWASPAGAPQHRGYYDKHICGVVVDSMTKHVQSLGMCCGMLLRHASTCTCRYLGICGNLNKRQHAPRC